MLTRWLQAVSVGFLIGFFGVSGGFQEIFKRFSGGYQLVSRRFNNFQGVSEYFPGFLMDFGRFRGLPREFQMLLVGHSFSSFVSRPSNRFTGSLRLL